MSKRVVVVGSYNQDHVWTCATLPTPGQTLTGSYATGPGGKGFNQAIAARRAGAETVFIAALGRDAAAENALALAREDGLDLRAERTDVATGCAAVLVDGQGGNQIVVAPGANAALSGDFIAAQADALAAAGVVLAQLEVRPEAVRAALERGRAHGAVTVLNPAPADAEVDRGLLDLADVLTPNETEFCALLRRHGIAEVQPEQVAGLDLGRLAELRDRLTAGTLIVTLGAEGCVVCHGQDRRGDGQAVYRVPAAPARAVDSTGAGDAFNGALAAALALSPEHAFVEHVRFASRYAAVSTERPGAALAMPRLAELHTRSAAADRVPSPKPDTGHS